MNEPTLSQNQVISQQQIAPSKFKNKNYSNQNRFPLLGHAQGQQNVNDFQLSDKEYEECLHFRDWVSFEKGNQYILGHYQGLNGLGLQVIRKTGDFKKYKSFGFFQVIPINQENKSLNKVSLLFNNLVTYSTPFYLMHIETGMYLSSIFEQSSKHALFDHIKLSEQRNKLCTFKFKKQIKGGNNLTQNKKSNQKNATNNQEFNHDFQFNNLTTTQLSTQLIKLNENLRVFNVATEKYIQLVKTQPSLSETYQQGQLYPRAGFEGNSYNVLGGSINKSKYAQNQKVDFMQHQQPGPNIWLSYNFDYFTLRLNRRSKEYNPLMLSNYECIMIYNSFTNSYIGVKKKKNLVDVINCNVTSITDDEILANEGNLKKKSIFVDKQPNIQKVTQCQKQTQANSYKISINANYHRPKNCLVDEVPAHSFDNRDTFGFLWKVFARQKNKVYSKQFLPQNSKGSTYPSLIKSKQILYFQHLETGLFMMKNSDQGQNGQSYILCQDYDDLTNDQRDQSGRFMFRAQNLCALRYNKDFILHNKNKDLECLFQYKSKPFGSTRLPSHPQPINISLPLTLDFQQQQFIISKLDKYPRIHYFMHHFPSFLELMISFLNNPKAIDDRIYLLKQKLKIMEMIYSKILCQGFVQIVKDIDKGYYFLEMTIKMLKIIRIKIKQYQLQALTLTNSKANNMSNSKSKPIVKRTNVDRKINKNNKIAQQNDNYVFISTSQPLEQLFELTSTIYQVLRPLLKRVLNYLSLVFSEQSGQIFQFFEQSNINAACQPNSYINYQPKNQTQEIPQIYSSMNNSKGAIIRKKQSTILTGSIRLRNNSASSFKSNLSSSSSNKFNQNNYERSIFANTYVNALPPSKQQCSSHVLKQLIKSLVYLIAVQPEASSQILKLLSTQQPYQIIAQINQQMQKLQSKLYRLDQNITSKKIQSAQSALIGTTLKLHKNFESCIYQQMLFCIKLINHIIQSFNQDLEYDWSKKLRYIQDNFQVKVNHSKEQKQLKQKQLQYKHLQLQICYKNRCYKLSQVLDKTQNYNFKRLSKWVRQQLKQNGIENKSNRNNSPPKLVKNRSQVLSAMNEKDNLLIVGNKDMQLQKLQSELQVISQNQNTSYIHSIKNNFSMTQQQQRKNRDKQISLLKQETRTKFRGKTDTCREQFYLVEQQQKHFFFECMKQIVKLKVVNLKSKGLPQMQTFPYGFQDMQQARRKSPMYSYKDLPSLSFVLQITNNIQVSLLNNKSSGSQPTGNINISLLNNSHFICCDFNPIQASTNLFKLFNYSIGQEQASDYEQQQLNNYPSSLIKQQVINYLIQQSPFCLTSLNQVFYLFRYPTRMETAGGLNAEVNMFIEAMKGLKILFVSLEIFVSLGSWNFNMLKRIEKYTLAVCEFIVFYSVRDYDEKDKPNGDQAQWYLDRCRQITTGVKDGLQSMMIELNQLLQILYIQKRRVIRYPYINKSTRFFQAQQFNKLYLRLITSSSQLIRQMPILTQMFQLNESLMLSTSILQLGKERGQAGKKKPKQPKLTARPKQFRHPYRSSKSKLSYSRYLTGFEVNYQQNEALLTWSYLSPQELIIFYPKQLRLYGKTFIRTSSTIIKLNELSLLLTTLDSLQTDQNIKNNFLLQIKQKISIIQVNLNDLTRLQGNRKVIKAFGLIEMILSIVINNTILEKGSIKPLLEFLVQIQMWDMTNKEIIRVLTKGGLLDISASDNNSEMARSYSINFLLRNIKKQGFFVIMAKYLEQKSSKQQKRQITDLIFSNVLQLLDYQQTQTHQSLMQKMSFLCMVVQIDSYSQFSRKIINKLLNRQDVQLYVQALKTYKNFESFCLNMKSIKTILQNKKTNQQKIYFQNYSSQNLGQNRSKNISAFSLGSNLSPNLKNKNKVSEFGVQRQEMTNQKREEINKFVLIMTIIFRICKIDNKLVAQYFGLFLSFKQFLKILKPSSILLGNSFQLFKPLFIFLQCNSSVFSQESHSSSQNLPHQSYSIPNSVCLASRQLQQNQLFLHLQPLNQILSLFHLYNDQLQNYQSSSTFFLPFVQQDEVGKYEQREHQQFNREKIKKIAADVRNFNKKTYFWQSLLWVPCYQKEQGLLVLIQRTILKNLRLFQLDRRSHKIRVKGDKVHGTSVLEKLQLPLKKILHSLFDNIVNLIDFLQGLQESRHSRLQTRARKLKRIFSQVFPTIQTSLRHLKSQKIRQSKLKNQTSGKVIQEQDEEQLGFLSSQQKKGKSHYSKQQSVQSTPYRTKQTNVIKRVQASTYTRQPTISKDKEKQQKQRAQLIAYQLVTKLANCGRLERFTKTFQDNELRRLREHEASYTKKSQREQLDDQISICERNKMFGDLNEYLHEQSGNCVLDLGTKEKRGSATGKSKVLSRADSKKSIDKKLGLGSRRPSCQRKQLQWLVDSSDYSHHAIIVAQSNLNEDLPNQCRTRQQQVLAASNKSQGTRKEQKFLTKIAFQSFSSMQDSKRTSYSNFHSRLKQYRFYEVVSLLRRVLFEHPACDDRVQLYYHNQLQYENQLYYELQQLLLEFFTCRGTVNLMFENIQNYLKMQAQKAGNRQQDYRFQYEGSTAANLQNTSYQHRRTLLKLNDSIQSSPPNKTQLNFNYKILLTLYNREKYELVTALLENLVTQTQHQKEAARQIATAIQVQVQNKSSSSPVDQNSQHTNQMHFNQPGKQKNCVCVGELERMLQFLIICLENQAKLSQSLSNQIIYQQNFQNIKISRNYSNNHEFLNSSKNRLDKASSLKYSKRHENDKNYQSSQQFSDQNISGNRKARREHNLRNRFKFERRLKTSTKIQGGIMIARSKLQIIYNILKLFNIKNKRTLSVQPLQQRSQQCKFPVNLLIQAHQCLKRYVYELICYLQVYNDVQNDSQGLGNSNIQVLIHQIRLLLLQCLPQIIVLLDLSFYSYKVGHLDHLFEQLSFKDNTSAVIVSIIEFSLADGYNKLDQYSEQNSHLFGMNGNNAQTSDRVDPLSLSQIQLLKEYIVSISQVIQNSQSINPVSYFQATKPFTRKILCGAIDSSLQYDLGSPNIESVQIISLLTAAISFLQVFFIGVGQITLQKDEMRDETFGFSFGKDNLKGQVSSKVISKLIQLQVSLYKLLFQNKSQKFKQNSYRHHLKYMMKLWQPQDQQNQQTYQQYFQDKAKAERYIVLLGLLMESLNIFHYLFYYLKPFPQYQDNLFQQRQRFILNSPRLNLQLQQLRQMYQHLNQLFGSVIISPQGTKVNRRIIATFPYFKQFQFMWKTSLIKLAQTFIDQESRKKLLFGAVQASLSQNALSRRIKYELIKITPMLSRVSQGLILAILFIRIFLARFIWSQKLQHALLYLNALLLAIVLIERILVTIIMGSITKKFKNISMMAIMPAIVLMYVPFIVTIGANVYSFVNFKALPFMLVVFLFNRLEQSYSFLQRNIQKIRSIKQFVLVNIAIIFAFHLLTRLRNDPDLVNQSYTTGHQPIFSMQDKPFNYLNMLFQLTSAQYITDPFVILFNIWIIFTQILVIAVVTFTIIDKLKITNTVNTLEGRINECFVCSKKGELLLQQSWMLGKKATKLQREEINVDGVKGKDRTHRNQVYKVRIQSDIYQPQMHGLSQDNQKNLLLKKVLTSHINQRHNIFQYISYFSYLLNKKEKYLTQKQKLTKNRIQNKDFDVYL